MPQPRVLVCWLLLLAYIAVFAHELAPDHDESDIECAVCLTADQLNDATLNNTHNKDSNFQAQPAQILHERPASSIDILIAASRDPPALG